VRGYSMDKQAYLSRLRKVEGQVRGLERMVDQDAYCIDVLTQIAAATRALQGVALGLLDEHLRHCVVGAVASPNGDGEAKLTEATRAVERLLKV
jgi:CsoR family transcriptional regulator, copper-sensing transcriptional repressor